MSLLVIDIDENNISKSNLEAKNFHMGTGEKIQETIIMNIIKDKVQNKEVLQEDKDLRLGCFLEFIKEC